jgi:hypothetical protein
MHSGNSLTNRSSLALLVLGMDDALLVTGLGKSQDGGPEETKVMALRWRRGHRASMSRRLQVHEPYPRTPRALLYFIGLTALCLASSSGEAEDYKYPFRDPYIATVTAAILTGDGLTPKPKRQVVHVPGLP